MGAKTRARILLALALVLGGIARSSGQELRQLHDSADASRATVRVHVSDRSPYRIPADITGKFAEHLGSNIYNGMDAQILRNPTFADYPFRSGPMTPDGVARFQTEDSQIDEELRRQG